MMEDMVLGILGGETPVITEIARQNSKDDGESWAVAKRMYRLLENKQVQTSQVYEGLYQVGCAAVAPEEPEYLVAAVDPVNFEKPYVKSIEGISTVHKATHPISEETKPAEWEDVKEAFSWLEKNHWTVRTWLGGARAFKGEPLPIRDRLSIVRLRARLENEFQQGHFDDLRNYDLAFDL